MSKIFTPLLFLATSAAVVCWLARSDSISAIVTKAIVTTFAEDKIQTTSQVKTLENNQKAFSRMSS